MRIGLFGDTYYPEKNGVAVSMHQLRQGLEAAGHEVFVFTIETKGMVPDPHVFRYPTVDAMIVKGRRVAVPHYRKWLKTVEELHLDVIHTQSEFTLGKLGKKAALKFHIPLVHTYHTIYEHSAMYFNLPISGTELMKKLIRDFTTRWCNGVDFVIVPTAKTYDLLVEDGVEKEMKIIPTGLDIRKYRFPDQDHVKELRKRFGLTETDKVLLYLGRVDPEKSIEVLLSYMKEAVRKEPRVKLVIVGDGLSLSSLKKQAAGEDLQDRVVFTGAADWDQVQDYFALGDIFVSASFSETQGLTYYEALSASLPVLGFRDRCLDVMITDGENGWQFDECGDFVEKMEQIFGSLSQFKKNAGKSAEKFTTEQFAADVAEIYRYVLQKRLQKK